MTFFINDVHALQQLQLMESQPLLMQADEKQWQAAYAQQMEEKLFHYDPTAADLLQPPANSAFVGDYYDFSQSPLWQMQRDYFIDQGPAAWQTKQVPHYITSNPTLAACYAEIIIHYLLDGLSQQLINVNSPIYMLELGAGSGRFAYYLLKQLEKKLPNYGLADLPLVLLISEFAPKNCEFLQQHPQLLPYLASGQVQVIQVDLAPKNTVKKATNNPFDNPALTQIVQASSNPLIAIANYVFDGLPQTLSYCHYGQFYQGEVAIESINGSAEKAVIQKHQKGKGLFKDLTLHYRWRLCDSLSCESLTNESLLAGGENLGIFPSTLVPSLEPSLLSIVQYYLKHLSSQPLLLPTSAMHCIQQLQQLARGQLLLLMADRGYSQLSQVRQQGLPRLAAHGCFSLPINFHGLAQWLEVIKAKSENSHDPETSWYFQQQHRDQGLVYQVLMINQPTSNDRLKDEVAARQFPATQHVVEQQLTGFNPDDFFMVKRSLHNRVEELTSEQMLSYCRLSKYDYIVLQQFLPVLLKQGVPINSRLDWLDCLQQTWSQYFIIGEQEEFAFTLGLLAIDLSGWGLAKTIYLHCLQWVLAWADQSNPKCTTNNLST
ncbi:hypothetical protein H0A36_13290, partial [Endozoicomonas sp. SM1973]